MKAIFTTLSFCLVFNCSVFGQYLTNETSVLTSGDSVIVKIATSFSYRFGDGSLPPLVAYNLTAQNVNLELNLFYDNYAASLNDFGGVERDTIYLTGFDTGELYNLKIISNIIDYDTFFHLSEKLFVFSILNETSNLLSQQISLYPNPATDAVTLNFSATITENSEVEILDAYGRIVKRISFPASNQTEINIPVSELASGLYFCKVSDGKKEKVLKFVKQ